MLMKQEAFACLMTAPFIASYSALEDVMSSNGKDTTLLQPVLCRPVCIQQQEVACLGCANSINGLP